MFSSKRIQTVYLVATTTRFYNDSNRVEFKISQEAYTTLEKAQKFCMSRIDCYQVDEYNFCSEPDDTNWYEYQILPVTLV